MSRIKVYIGTILPGIPYTEMLYPNLGNTEAPNAFGEKIFDSVTVPFVDRVELVEDADYICIPHNYNYIKKNREYIEEFVKIAESSHKKILVFFPGDSDEDVSIPYSIVFRNSQYGYKKKVNEIITPAYSIDLALGMPIIPREKGDVPVIGFCGWATYKSAREWISYIIGYIKRGVHKKGLYYRRKVLAYIQKSNEVISNFIIRSSYSGSAKTIGIDPVTARREYRENMINSDFILAPKGDGNFSLRFFEALSLGRIPLLIDTDCPLPLSHEIDYSRCVLKVDHTNISTIATTTRNFYNSLSPEEYRSRQMYAREIYEKYLKIDVFFRYVMTQAFLQKIAYTIDIQK